jgi:hypothetical protein
MKATTIISCIVLVLFPLQQRSSGWRGIIPLHSTRADVERLLGAASDECRCLYKSRDENVHIEYSIERCGQGERNELDVPPDTVLTVAVYLKRKPLWSELGLDSTRFEKTEDPELRGNISYTSYQEGVTYSLGSDRRVFEITYFGTLKDRNNLRCPSK